ncbi:MAG: HdaA/DnaA family protein [Burkholderiaceae bacterium]
MTQQLVLDIGPAIVPTLENYLPGSNAQAIAALRAIARGDRAVQFITLWGPKGSGKSHLIAAVGGHLLTPRSQRGAFERAQQAGLVVIDDVQAMDSLQQIGLFNLYNLARQDPGKAIVAACSTPVVQCPVREDLRTRMAWGLVFGLSPLTDAQASSAIVARAAQHGVSIAPDVAPYLMTRFARDMGTLMRIVDALDKYSLQTKRAITLPLARELIAQQNQTGSRAF